MTESFKIGFSIPFIEDALNTTRELEKIASPAGKVQVQNVIIAYETALIALKEKQIRLRQDKPKFEGFVKESPESEGVLV